MDIDRLLITSLLVFVIPCWLAAGFADWLCHRSTHLSETSGSHESVLHLALLAEGAIGLLAGLLLEINAFVLAVMLAALIAHEVTVYLDLRYTAGRRAIAPIEQMVHSMQEILPVTGMLIVALVNWEQFSALFGLADNRDFSVRLKNHPLPAAVVASILTAALLLGLLPFAQEYWRARSRERSRSARETASGSRSTPPADIAS